MNACERMRGEVKGNVCFIDKFPTHVNWKDWYGEFIVPESESKGKALFLQMSPNDAKKLFPPMNVEDLATGKVFERYMGSSIKELRERIKKGEPINPPWMQVCLNIPAEGGFEKSWFKGHEGRHRIEAARLEGSKVVPVFFLEKDKSFCESQMPRDWKRLKEMI